jgi:hypothetical protein
MRWSSARTPALPSALAVNPTATREGAKTPGRKNIQRIPLRAETPEALLNNAPAAMKKAHATAYVSEKKVSREPADVDLAANSGAPKPAFCLDGSLVIPTFLDDVPATER